MSVVKLKVYSKKWQSPLKVTAVSVFGLFKELFAMPGSRRTADNRQERERCRTDRPTRQRDG